MLKFIRGKGQQPSAERLRLQKELYEFNKTVTHGFPHKPSALAYDPILNVLAIGTQTGAIKIFGRPGVEFYGQHEFTSNEITDQNVQLLEWVYGTGRLISLTTGNQLTLWEPGSLTIIPIKTLTVDGKLKKISCICSSLSQDNFWLGTEAGSVYQVQLQAFEISEPILTHEQFLQQIPPTYKVNPGAVECIRQLPHLQNELLIAFNRGLCVLWNTETSSVVRSFIVSGHGQSVGIHLSITGADFTWYHADGSYATWKTDSIELPKDVSYVPYGPDPCKSINRLYKGKRDKFDVVVFSGGMPRSAYGDHNCVSVHCSDGSKICLDFTSKVIDFVVTYKEQSEFVQVLIVLLEEELCAYDLTDVAVPSIKMPYLHSLHASAITCNYIASQVPKDVYEKIVKAGAEQNTAQSDMEWPIMGGEITEVNDDEENDDDAKYDILLTGHEDGSVKFWDCTDLSLVPICVFNTAPIFRNENDGEYGSDGEIWSDSEPPFRKAGHFDPYSDDPRLAIKKIVLCTKTGHCLIGGTAGQLILTNFDSEENTKKTFHFMTMNLVNDRDGFLWKGHDQLSVRQTLLEEQEFLENTSCANVVVVQVLPPAGITSLALETDWGIISAGTAHGLVAYDFKNLKPIFHRCTLNPNDINGAGEQLSRRKSFKKSLRESFRKLRKGRSTRRNNAEPQTTLAARPVERQIEARSSNDDGMGSMVRFLLFAKTHVANGHTVSPTLWSATNSGTVSVFLLHLQRSPGSIAAQLAKEIQLKHRAPVVGITVFDQNAAPVGANNPGPSPHRVLIASEEQFKIFSLPQLKPMNKYKLTANEGTRIRRIHVCTFSCKMPTDILDVSSDGTPKHTRSTESSGDDGREESNKIYSETALLALTNLGEVMALSIPELRRQFYASVIRREDINGISSLCFTNYGEALYFISSSELQRVSFCTQKLCLPKGKINVVQLAAIEDSKKDVDDNSDLNFALRTPTATPVPQKRHSQLKSHETEVLENGYNGVANETQFSNSLGDITMDSVRDHLNTTTSTLCSTVTDESVGRLSITSTQKHVEETAINVKNFLKGTTNSTDKNNTTVSSDSSVTIKATITTIAQNERDSENTKDSAPMPGSCRESRL